MKRALTITTDFRRHWDSAENDGPWWPMIREFIQGALDEQTVNPKNIADIEYDPEKAKITISSKNVKLDFSVLLLGESTKMDSSETIGGFGEGMKIAMLMAVRNNIPIKIRNGADEVWLPTLEPDSAFSNRDVLTVEKKRAVRLTKSFDIELTGVTKTIWDQIYHRILFLSVPTMLRCEQGDIIIDEAYKGEIYIKGVFIQKHAGFNYGYNFKNVKCDSDRKMVSYYDLKEQSAKLWAEVANHGDDESFALFYKLLSKDKVDVEEIETDLFADTLTKLVDMFKSIHGEEAIPILESEDLNSNISNVITITTPYFLTKLLRKQLTSYDSIKQEYNEQRLKVYAIDDLTNWQRKVFCYGNQLLNIYNDTFTVVDFQGEHVLYLRTEDETYISRKLLVSLGEYVCKICYITGENFNTIMPKLINKIFEAENQDD